MYKFHEKCKFTTLSPDRGSGTGTGPGTVTGEWGFVFSDRPLEDGTTFTCKLSSPTPWAELKYDYLSSLPFLGVTTDNPASLSDPPYPGWFSVWSVSSLVNGNGSLLKRACRPVGESDVRLDPRGPTEVGVRLEHHGKVRVYQDGVDKGVVNTGLRGPVWAMVCPGFYNIVSVVCKETTTIAPELMPVPVTYKMDSRPRGYAVIVNMSQVWGEDDRPGSDNDVTRLTTLFRKLHFKVKTFTNQSAKDIHKGLKSISKRPDLKSQDAFVLVLMSHGGPGFILGADGDMVNLEKTFWLFSNNGCPALRKKPKLFFIQACNGGKLDNGDQVDAGPDSPKIAELPAICDMLVAKASVKGYQSVRNESSGSRFIQSLVDEFEEHAALLDVGHMMTRVISRVHGKATSVTQCPVFKSTLTKDVYLRP